MENKKENRQDYIARRFQECGYEFDENSAKNYEKIVEDYVTKEEDATEFGEIGIILTDEKLKDKVKDIFDGVNKRRFLKGSVYIDKETDISVGSIVEYSSGGDFVGPCWHHLVIADKGLKRIPKLDTDKYNNYNEGSVDIKIPEKNEAKRV